MGYFNFGCLKEWRVYRIVGLPGICEVNFDVRKAKCKRADIKGMVAASIVSRLFNENPAYLEKVRVHTPQIKNKEQLIAILSEGLTLRRRFFKQFFGMIAWDTRVLWRNCFRRLKAQDE